MTKTAFITGATSGIGKSTAIHFALNGINLVLCGRRQDRLDALKVELGKEVQVHTLNFDIRNKESVHAAISSLPKEFAQVDILINNDADNPEDIFADELNLKDELYKLMSPLDDREKNIVIDYYGLCGTPMTLQEIGDELNLTKERVRQIKEKVLRKLRNDSYQLLEYLND